MQPDSDLNRDIAMLFNHLDSAVTIYRSVRKQFQQRAVNKSLGDLAAPAAIGKIDDAFKVWEDELEKLARDIRITLTTLGWPQNPP